MTFVQIFTREKIEANIGGHAHCIERLTIACQIDFGR
jgi:hypothetical protein